MWHCSLSILKKSFKEQVLYIRATAVQRLRKGRGAGEGPAGEAQEAREPMGKLGEGEAGGGGRSAGNSRDGGQVQTAGTARGEGGGCAVTPPPQKHREDDLEVFSKVRAVRRRVPGKFQVNSRSWPRRAAAALTRSPGPAGGSEPRVGGSSQAA